MSNLIVIIYDDPNGAFAMRNTLKSVQQMGKISLDDSAVVLKDADGKVHVKHQMDRGIKIGAVGGGVLGLLLASIFFPIGGIVIGAIAGGLIGKSADMGISHKFVDEVKEELKPNSSALFVIVRDADPAIALSALRQHKGTGRLIQSTLPTEDEEQLRKAIEKGHTAVDE
jgi:uncharacterized membrane protein